MKTKLVYSVVSTNDDFYLDQAYVSMSSAKRVMPDVHITLVIDSRTSETLYGFRQTEANTADEIIVVEIDPLLPEKKRSRILKTSLRNIVNGDFLYVDSDTLIIRDLSDVDSFDFCMGAVGDLHVPFAEHPIKRLLKPDLEKMGVIINNGVYYNSGVIYAKDNTETRNFFKIWNQYYLEGYSKSITQDQPAFAKTQNETHLISNMDDEWNCQILSGLSFLNKAKIWHYFSSITASPYILNDTGVLNQIKTQMAIPDSIKVLFDNPYLGFRNNCRIICGGSLNLFFSFCFEEFLFMADEKSAKRKFIIKCMKYYDYYQMKMHNIKRRIRRCLKIVGINS